MVTCIILIDSVDTINVSLMRDDKLLANYIGDMSISHFINDKIDCLKVMFKPSLCNSVPDDGYKLDNVSVNNVNKNCVISYDDFKNLSSLCVKVKDIEIYNYIDVYKSTFKDRDRVVIVDSWSKSLASVIYMEFGSIVDFRRVSYSKLSPIIHKFSEKYNCFDVINACRTFDYVGLNSVIGNLSEVDKDRVSSLKHLVHCLETEGISILETNEFLNWSEDSEDIDPSNAVESKEEFNENHYSKKLKENDFEVESNIDDKEETFFEDNSDIIEPSMNQEVKVGFFAKLFGKKSKQIDNNNKSNFDKLKDREPKSKPSRKTNRKDSKFSQGDDSEPTFKDELGEDEEDGFENYFSQVAVGDHRSSRRSNGFNPNVRKYSGVDYAFYIGFIMFFCVSLIFGGLQFIYKEKVGILSDSYSSAIKMKNQMESNVEISSTPAESPVVKISQLNKLSLPSSYKIISVNYTGQDYKVVLSISDSDSIDDFKSFLPDSLVISQIDPKSSDDGSKIYDITLVVS